MISRGERRHGTDYLRQALLLCGRQTLLSYSGEFHYFRVPRRDWRQRMELFKQAGGNCFWWDGLAPSAMILGRHAFSGRPVAWEWEAPDGGKAIVLGFAWSQAVRQHERMLAALLSRLGTDEKVLCTNPNLWTSLRTAEERSILFILNLFTAPMEAVVCCQPPWSGEMIDCGVHRLEPTTVKRVDLRGQGCPRTV